MRIVTSTILSDRRQIDDRRHIHERHVDSTGRHHDCHWLAEERADVARIMRNRVPAIESQLARRAAEDVEREGLEARQRESLRRLDVAEIADVLMVNANEAARLKNAAMLADSDASEEERR